ncbi:MAG TPA: thiamine pyrophosphate-binding protein [Nitrolancea sp.]|jgi:acetolactate synthase-1/2/3 large subunit|nr:thiamine pyrophosphate-binding protein [Nitrolancea sp.]
MSINGAHLLARALRDAGVARLFSLSGNQILPIYDACLDEEIAVTDTRHESAAAHMADAWAKVRGEPGVCLVTAGPGHTNTVTGIANAMASETPVLWLSGASEQATVGLGGFQELDQVAVARPVCKAAWTVERASDIPVFVGRAWRTMLEGRPGPVYLGLPSDVLTETIPDSNTHLQEWTFRPALRFAEPSLIQASISLLHDAASPLILVSPSVARGEAGARLRQLGERTGIPYLVLESARGLADPAYNGVGAAVAKADVILLVAPQDFMVRYGRGDVFAEGARVIHVAPRSADVGRNAPVTLGVAGDAAAVLTQLADAATTILWSHKLWAKDVAALRSANRHEMEPFERSEETPIHPLRVAAELRAMLPPGSQVAQDGGEFGQWMRWGMAGASFTPLLHGKLGSIGSAIPLAIGAAVANPGTPTFAVLGDGTFGFHGMEFDTAVRHSIPFVAVVGNDASWAAERHRQVRIYGEDRVVASDLLPTRYDEVVRGLGGHGEYVVRPEEIRPALERALASGRPACVNVMIQSIPSPAALP